MKELKKYGKTHLTVHYPWGWHPRNGHRLLCPDGIIRAAELAETSDTFFSTPARVRVRGKWVSGYATTQEGLNDAHKAYCFRAYENQDFQPFPDWPNTFSKEMAALLAKAHE